MDNKKIVDKFAALLEKVFSANIEKLSNHDTKKYQTLFSDEYGAAIKIVVAVKDSSLLTDLTNTYLSLYAKYASNPDAIHFYRSDQLFALILEQSIRVTDASVFETWDGLLSGNDKTDKIVKRFTELNSTDQSNVKAEFSAEREKRRKSRSILDVLKDEYMRQHGVAPSSNDRLYDFDPRPNGALALLDTQLAAVKATWEICRASFTKENGALLNGVLVSFRNIACSLGKQDALALFQLVKSLQDLFNGKIELAADKKSNQPQTKISVSPDNEVLFHALHAIACIEIVVVAQVKKMYARNLNGFTKEELDYFFKSVERSQFYYRSNIRKFIGPVSYEDHERTFKPDLRLGEVQSFVGMYLLTKNQLSRMELVPLKKTMEIQNKWEQVRSLTDLIQMAARNNDEKRLRAIFADSRNEDAIGLLKEISSTTIDVKNPQVLGQGTLAAGSRFGEHNQYGDIGIVYIDPKDTNQIYVEVAALKPQIFLVHEDYVADKFYGAALMEIYRSTIGMVYITEAIFMALGFLPVFIEAGFAGLIYEIVVFYVSDKIGEQASKINPAFGQILALLLQTFAPRPHFAPKVNDPIGRPTDKTGLSDVLDYPGRNKDFLDRATGVENEGTTTSVADDAIPRTDINSKSLDSSARGTGEGSKLQGADAPHDTNVRGTDARGAGDQKAKASDAPRRETVSDQGADTGKGGSKKGKKGTGSREAEEYRAEPVSNKTSAKKTSSKDAKDLDENHPSTEDAKGSKAKATNNRGTGNRGVPNNTAPPTPPPGKQSGSIRNRLEQRDALNGTRTQETWTQHGELQVNEGRCKLNLPEAAKKATLGDPTKFEGAVKQQLIKPLAEAVSNKPVRVDTAGSPVLNQPASPGWKNPSTLDTNALKVQKPRRGSLGVGRPMERTPEATMEVKEKVGKEPSSVEEVQFYEATLETDFKETVGFKGHKQRQVSGTLWLSTEIPRAGYNSNTRFYYNFFNPKPPTQATIDFLNQLMEEMPNLKITWFVVR